MVLGYSRLIWGALRHASEPADPCCVAMSAAFEAIGGRSARDPVRSDEDGQSSAKARQRVLSYNRALVDLARHYGFHPRACRPYRAKTKGKVEEPFRYNSGRLLLARSFRNLDDLNAHLRHWLDSVANPRTHATTLTRRQ